MSSQPGFIDRVLGSAFDIIGKRWWLSLPAALLSFAYPVYYFLNWDDQSYSRAGFKLVIALIILGLALTYGTYLAFTSPPPDLNQPGS